MACHTVCYSVFTASVEGICCKAALARALDEIGMALLSKGKGRF